MLNENKYIESLNNALKNDQYFAIDSIFSEYESLDNDLAFNLMKLSLKSDLVLKNYISKANNFANYWKLLDRWFFDFNHIEKDIILNQIKGITIWNIEVEKSIYQIIITYSNVFDDERKIKTYLEYLTRFLSNGILIPFIDLTISDKILNVLWIIKRLESKSFFLVDKITNSEFDLNKSTFPLFLEVIKKLDYENEYNSISNLVEDSHISFLINLLSNEKLSYLGKTIFPAEFYKIHLIQKIYIYISTVLENVINKNTIERVGKYLDLNYRFYGNNIKLFLINNIDNLNKENIDYSKLLSKKYYDSYFKTNLINHIENPFVNLDNMDNKENVDDLIKTLNKNKTDIRIEFGLENTINAQNKEIIEKLNVFDKWSTNRETYSYFLNKLITISFLRKNYKQSIIELLIFGISNKLIDDTLVNEYLKKILISNYLTLMDFHLQKLFEELIKAFSEEIDTDRYFYKVLFQNVKIDKLKNTNESLNSSSNFVDILEFLNSDLGRYYQLIKKTPRNIFNKNYDYFIASLNTLSQKFKSYLSGTFYYHLNEGDKPKFSNELMLIGFSHSYYISPDDKLTAYFKAAALALFNSNIEDKLISRNIAIIICTNFDIDKTLHIEKISNNFRVEILKKIMHFYLFYENIEKTYTMLWIKYFYESFEFSLDIISSEVIDNLYQVNTTKVIDLVRNLKTHNIYSNSKKINDYIILTILELDKYEVIHHNTLYVYLEFVLNSYFLTINPYTIKGLSLILSDLKNKRFYPITDNYLNLLKLHIIPVEYEKIYDEFGSL